MTMKSIEIVRGESKTKKDKNGNPIKWAGILLKVGDWSTMIFPKSKFELDYIEKILNGEK